MNARGIAKIAGATAAAAAGLAGAAYAGERVLASRLKHRPDGDAARALDAPVYVDQRLDAHDGGSIYLVEAGEGPPIVLSHGVTNSIRSWFHQLEALPEAGFRALAYDHRGHGQSKVGTAGHSLANLAADMRSVVEGLDLRDAVLVGHSMGGVAVQAFMTEFPEIAKERVAGIVLLSTLAKAPFGSHSTRTKKRFEEVTNRAPDMSWVWNSEHLGFLIARLGFGKDPHPSHVELVRQMLRDCPPETRLDAPRALMGLDTTPDLPNVHIPTLVIVGTGDMLTPPAQARLIAKLIPDARLEVFPGGGHMLMLERYDELNRLLVDFAREVTGVGTGARRLNIARAEQPVPDGVALPIAGLRVGHWTGVGTGVTVVLPPAGTVGSCEVRGGAPATRELALLDPGRTVANVDAVVFAGGSAFGLAAADGVMRFLVEHGRGFPTAGGPVPIVPTACVFDLVETDGPRPGPDQGYAAAAAAADATPTGRVGVGCGATVGKWRGREHAVAGGFGVASARADAATVVAFAVVNAVGDVIAADGTVLAGSAAPAGSPAFPADAPFEEDRANTTLVVVVTDAVCDKAECHLLAQSAHDGFARALHPAHTRFDGDVAIALATGGVDAHLDRVRIATADAVAEAIRAAPR